MKVRPGDFLAQWKLGGHALLCLGFRQSSLDESLEDLGNRGGHAYNAIPWVGGVHFEQQRYLYRCRLIMPASLVHPFPPFPLNARVNDAIELDSFFGIGENHVSQGGTVDFAVGSHNGMSKYMDNFVECGGVLPNHVVTNAIRI